MGKLLNAQPYESPVEGWTEGMHHPLRKLGRVIVLPLPEAAGVFQWTLLGESDLQDQPKRSVVPLPNPERLEIEFYGADSIVRCQQDRMDKGLLGLGISLCRYQGPEKGDVTTQ